MVIPLYSKTGTSDLNNEKLFPKIAKMWKSRQCSLDKLYIYMYSKFKMSHCFQRHYHLFCLLQDERQVLECLCDCDYDVDATVAYILQTMETVIGECLL